MVFRRRDRPPFVDRARDFVYPRSGWRRALEYVGHRVRRIPDTPQRIALGFACGVFASFSPLFGLHFFYAAFLAWLVGGNVVASLVGTFAGNPLTFPLIASVSMALGRRILGYGGSGRDFGRVTDAFKQGGEGLWQGLKSLFGYGEPDWNKLAAFFTDVLWPYFVGGLLPGLVAAVASYYVTLPLIAAYQAARRQRLADRSVARAATRESEADDAR
jgi:uncharacterized protein (DUF2062 family)